MQLRKVIIMGAIALSIGMVGQVTRAQQKEAVPSSRFEQFKALEGEWTGETKGEHAGGEMKVVYHVTSGGSAVTETIGPGTDHEMVTVITKDHANVALTHYCAMGNQPHMTVQDAGSGKVVAFKFQSLGNMSTEQDTHMHNVTYTFVDKDHLTAEWTMYVKGKATGAVKFALTRKK